MENEVKKTENSQNIKLYSILSYIGILWIVGLFVKEKDNKSLRFHVGQGMLLTVIGFGANMIMRFLSTVLLNIVKFIFGQELLFGLVAIFLLILSFAVTIGTFALMIIGIVNAANGKDEELPVVGKYAFYK